MIYNVQNDFIKIGVTSGTIQNNSYINDVEISNSAVNGSGIILRPLNKFTFTDQTIYARCVSGGWAEIRVVPFVVDGGSVVVNGGSSAASGGASFNQDDFNFIFG